MDQSVSVQEATEITLVMHGNEMEFTCYCLLPALKMEWSVLSAHCYA